MSFSVKFSWVTRHVGIACWHNWSPEASNVT